MVARHPAPPRRTLEESVAAMNAAVANILAEDEAVPTDDDDDPAFFADRSDARALRDAHALADEGSFLPVPVRPRADGWTAAKQVAFLGWLGDLGSVGEAAAMVGMSSAGAYRLRKRAGAGSFVTAWDCALLWAGESLMQRSVRRAIDGTAVPVIVDGRVTRVRRVFDNALLMQLMTRVEGRQRRRHRRRVLA